MPEGVELCTKCGKNPRTRTWRICADCLKEERRAYYERRHDYFVLRARLRYRNLSSAERTEYCAKQTLRERARRVADPEYAERRRAASRQYSRAYYKEHREELLAGGHGYYEKAREERREYGRKYYLAHCEQLREYSRRYYLRKRGGKPRVPAAERPCAKCNKGERIRGKSYCRECEAVYQHAYYLKHRGFGRNGRDQVTVEAPA